LYDNLQGLSSMSPRIKTPEILPVMVGTAGHVDHGKTSLVRLLTGCDTDRLPEEKARGMSIDLGFAPCLLPGNRMIGIIDVPGHLDFIRNMVAGASSMDILLLVIAADDGIMPQTEEHLRIIRLLRAPRLLVALTKTDLVDAETLALAQEEVAEFAARAGYPETPVVPVSNLTGEGIPAVREALDGLVQGLLGRVPDGRAFRMGIERVFAVPGHGTVVTGIPASGRIAVGDEVLVLPGKVSARVRSIQNYHHLAETTGPNVCAALNLANIAAEDVRRGMCISSPVGEYRSTHFALAQVVNEDPHKILRHNAELRLHCGTASSPTRVSFLAGVDLPPGGTGFAKLRLAESLVLAAGDRFILRRPSPSTTLGGGVILSAIPQRAKSHDEAMALRLVAAAEAVAAHDLPRAELMARPSPVLLRRDFPGVFRQEDATADAEVRRLVQAGVLGELAEGGSCIVLPRLDELAAQVRIRLRRHHRDHPQHWGPDAAEIAAWLGIKTGEFAKFAEWTTTRPGSGIRPRHGRLALADFEPEIPDVQQALRQRLEAHLIAVGIVAPAIGDLVTEFAMDKKDLQALIRILVEERKIVTVGNHLLSAEVFQRCTESVREFFVDHPVLGIGEFRERTGAARNFAVALLEKFDALGLTRRTPDGRVPGPRLTA
jgi:selenocysteine-specific elongation factor